jgi:hypothetical protein
MNAYSYKQENQDAFGAWFDSIPTEKKREYLSLLRSGDFGQWAYDALAEGNQDAEWCDALHDSLYTWGQETEPQIKTITLDLPSHWACPLINGDESGLEDEEQGQLDAWVKDNPNLYCIDVSEETFFYTYHSGREYGVLPCDCAEFTFQEITE